MKKDIRKQYNTFAEEFSIQQQEKDQRNRELMYSFVGNSLKGKKVLDLGCGDGIDVEYYRNLGAQAIGLDASEKLIEIARKKYPKNTFHIGFAENLPYENDSFDAVYSKYAIMTSRNMKPIFDEVARVLKPGGEFIYLATHPFRQYLELEDLSADYFSQQDVDLVCLDGTVVIKEPTHTFNEFFNKEFFSKFEMVDFLEAHDPAAAKIQGGRHPSFFIVKAIRKKKYDER